MMSETAGNNDPRLSPDAQVLWLNTLEAFFKAKPALMALVYWNDQGQYLQANPGYGGSGYTLQGSGMATFKTIANDPYFH